MRKSVLAIPLLSFWAIIALAAPPPASTAVSPAKAAKIRELLKEYDLPASIERGRNRCVQDFLSGMFSPGQVAKEKGSYRGFKPGTADWPKVLAAYKIYAEQSCAYQTLEPYEQAYIKYYGSRLSEADIDGYLAFQKTPAAQHMLAAQRDTEPYMAEFEKGLREPAFTKADNQYQATLEGLRH